MAGSGKVLLLCLVLVASPLVGCIGADQPVTDDEATPSADDEADEPSDDRNTFLLDEPRPASTTVSEGAEPIILADQAGEYLLIADTSGIYKSTDDGTSWSDVTPVFPPGAFIDGISLAQDDTGTIYGADTNGNTISVAKSNDGGDSWTTTADVPTAARPIAASGLADRPWLAATGDDQVGLVYYDVARGASEQCLSSFDGADTFPDREVLPAGSPNAGNAIFDEDGALYYAVDGTLYRHAPTTTQQLPQVGEVEPVCNSPLGQRTLLSDVGADVFTEAVSDGEREWIAAPSSDNGEILLGGSDDLDETQTLTFTPSDGDQRLRTNTFVTLSAQGDELAIGWYGTQTAGDPTSQGFDGEWNVFVATIDDPWNAPEQISCDSAAVDCTRLTNVPNHVGQICMNGSGCGGEDDRDLLDYFGADHGPDGKVHVAYGHDGSGSDAEVRYACASAGCKALQDNVPPVADFTYSCGGLTCEFDASPTENPDGPDAALTYEWDFGDGSTGTGEVVEHDYADTGAYEVTLNVSEDGLRDTATDTVRLLPPIEFALEPAKETFRQDERVRLHVNATDADTGEPFPTLPVTVGTVLQSGQFTVDQLLSGSLLKSTLQANDVVYHEASGETDENGHAKLVLSCQSDDAETCLDGVTDPPVVDGPAEFQAQVVSDLDDVTASARTTYNVAPSP